MHFFNFLNLSSGYQITRLKISFNCIWLALASTLLLIFFWLKLQPNYGILYLGKWSKDAEANNTVNCSPIIMDSNRQYSVEIDGVRYPKFIPLYKNRSINFECLRQSKSVKIILAWNGFFGGQDAYGSALKNKMCPITNCLVSSEKRLINQSDLVLVHMRDPVVDPPTHRPWFQRWVFVLYESPVHSGDFRRFNQLFNLTSTYRIESNFSGFYEAHASMQWELNPSFDESFDYLQAKSKFAAAVISNCGASSRRLEYISEMQKSISVDIFGGCGQTCPTKFANSTPGACKDILGKEYKFYLAFENSICADYVTEKFFYILKHEIIPVVLGGGSYNHYVPKSGYIDAQEFQSPKMLAEYLTYLSNNSTAYNSFFKWKKHVRFQNDALRFPTVCDMCIQLHLEEYFGIGKSIIGDMGAYWNKKKDCKNLKF